MNSVVEQQARVEAMTGLSSFRESLFDCLTARADELFELSEAVLCADGPVKTLVGLSLVPEHRRGQGALYDAVNCGRIDCARLRTTLDGLPLPRAADGRLVLAVDVSPWLRPDADTSPDRSFCHTYGRGKDKHQMIPGWPYSHRPRWKPAARPGPRRWTRSGCTPALATRSRYAGFTGFHTPESRNPVWNELHTGFRAPR